MNLILIVAVSENNVIGRGLEIPWHFSEDLKRFKELTLNHPVIMGRKTYKTILSNMGKPLPNRKNIVMSNTLAETEGIYIARNIDEALKLTEHKDSYVIGGEEIYKSFLPLANKIELTRIHGYYDGNIFFPNIDCNKWRQTFKDDNNKEFTFLAYERIKQV